MSDWASIVESKQMLNLPSWATPPFSVEVPSQTWMLELTELGSATVRVPIERCTILFGQRGENSDDNNENSRSFINVTEGNVAKINTALLLNPKSSDKRKLLFHLMDLGYEFGTKLNGVTMSSGDCVAIKVGDKFSIGDSERVYRLVRGVVERKGAISLEETDLRSLLDDDPSLIIHDLDSAGANKNTSAITEIEVRDSNEFQNSMTDQREVNSSDILEHRNGESVPIQNEKIPLAVVSFEIESASISSADMNDKLLPIEQPQQVAMISLKAHADKQVAAPKKMAVDASYHIGGSNRIRNLPPRRLESATRRSEGNRSPATWRSRSPGTRRSRSPHRRSRTPENRGRSRSNIRTNRSRSPDKRRDGKRRRDRSRDRERSRSEDWKRDRKLRSRSRDRGRRSPIPVPKGDKDRSRSADVSRFMKTAFRDLEHKSSPQRASAASRGMRLSLGSASGDHKLFNIEYHKKCQSNGERLRKEREERERLSRERSDVDLVSGIDQVDYEDTPIQQ
jgi:hypothetical protein